MITRFIIGNFKPIRGPVEIDLRPITLLFGPNAAGKSSILQAVHYAIEMLEGRTLDTRHTRLGGDHVNLGGFAHFVHGRNPAEKVTLGFEQRWSDGDRTIKDTPYERTNRVHVCETALACSIRQRIFSHRIEWKIGYPERATAQLPNELPLVTDCRVELNDEPILTIRIERTPRIVLGRQIAGICLVARVVLRHPLLSQLTPLIDASAEWATVKELVEAALGRPPFDDGDYADVPIRFEIRDDFAADIHRIEARPRADARVKIRTDVVTQAPDKSPAEGDVRAQTQLADLLDMIIVEPIRQLAIDLLHTIHVGPLRTLPGRERGFIKLPDITASESRGKANSWYDGTAAWHIPHDSPDPQETLAFVNTVLHEKFLMDTSMWLAVVRQRWFIDNRDEVFEAIEQSEGGGLHSDYGQDREARDVPALEPFVATFGKGKELLKRMTKRELIALVETINVACDALPSDDRLVLFDERRQIDLTLQDVGTGIGQVIPILMAVFWTSSQFCMIEQPELHLHPRAQVALGDALIYRLHLDITPSMLLVETHSEHLLLRLLRRIRQTNQGQVPDDMVRLDPEQLAVVYVEHSAEGAHVRRLRVDDRGEFVDRWPSGFFEERAEELFS